MTRDYRMTPSPSTLATSWARERAPIFVIALRTCVRIFRHIRPIGPGPEINTTSPSRTFVNSVVPHRASKRFA